MTPTVVTTYSGRSGQTGLSDLTTAQELEFAIRGTDVLVIRDPLSFPWEWFEETPIRCPIVLDVGACSDADIVALAPAVTGLTASDRISGAPATVAALCETLGLPNIWTDIELDDGADMATFAAGSQRSKLADVEQARIITRLAEDDDLIIRVIDGDQLRTNRSGFPALVEQISNDLDGAIVDTIWGIHPEPGTPVERAVLALRPRATT